MYAIHTLIDDSILVCHFGDIRVRGNTEVTGGLEKQENKDLQMNNTVVVTFSRHINNTLLDAMSCWMEHGSN